VPGGKSSERPLSRRGTGRPAGPPRKRATKSGAAVRRASTAPAGTGGDAGAAGRPKWTTRAAVLAIVLVALIASYAGTMRNWIDQRQQLSQLRQENQDRIAAVADLQHEVRRWDDPAFVESQARSRFGWVMPGEVGYVVIDDTGQPATVKVKATGKAGSHQTPWWTELRRSIESADHAPGTAPGVPTPTPTPEKTIGPEDTG
jgi:cell division protein FtsB